jgi:hypothetical protein
MLGIATTSGEEYCILAKFADENAKKTSDNFVLLGICYECFVLYYLL